MPTISNSSVRSDLPTRERLTAVSNELATSTSKTGSSSDVERFSAFGKTSTTASQSKRTSVVSRSDTKGFTDVSEVDRLSDEEQDQLLPLPQGWPRLQDQIFRRRALSFKKPVSTSIDHAISHIQKLQDRLEEWARDVEFEIMSRKTNSSCATSVCCSNRDSATSARERTVTDTRGSDRRHIRFAPTSAASVEASESTLESRQSENVTDLSIQGIGAIMPPGLEMEIEAEIPTLGAEEVIDETVTLLGRLETDRRDTADRLEEEKKRSDMLRARIDKLAEKRMYELPLAVQHEHEACALDISELQWHVAYRGRQEARIRSKVDIAEVLNSRLLEDINFVKTHSPLVEEKLELELEAMHKIQDAQMQTNDELAKTVEKLKQTESKSEEAHGKAEMERAHIKKELDTVRQALHEISTELDEARKTFTSYTQQCDDSRRKLQDNVQEQIVLETKNENARAAEKMQGKKVKQVKEKIVEAEFEHRKLKDENTKMASDKDSRSTILKKEDNEMEYEAQSKLSTLRETQHKNKEMKMEIEDIGEKLAACHSQKKADEKNAERIKKEMGKVEQQLAITLEEHKRVETINKAIREKLMKEEENIQGSEDQLKTTAEALRRQLKDEQHSRTVLQARIAGDSAELQKLQLDSKKKKLKISKKADETDKVVNLVSQQVEQLKKVYNDKTKRIAKLEEQISLFKNKHRETKEHLAKKKEELEPEHKHVKEENLNKTKRLDYMKHRTEVIDKKMEEMDSSSVIMKKVLSNTENDILELSAEMGEMAIRLETGQKMHDDLKIALEEVEKRSEEQACQHENHLKERQIVLNDLEAQLEKKLEENERLAHQYRYLQDKVIATKDKLMNEFDGKIKFESSLKDHKQLNGLQSRLHASLAIYYKIRGLYNQAELAKFEAVSQKNGQRIHILQVDMDEAISTIALFLNDQIDGTAAQMVAAAAKSALFENSDPIPQTKKLKSALKKPVST